MQPVGSIKESRITILTQVAITSEGQESPGLIERKMVCVSELVPLYNTIASGTVGANAAVVVGNAIFHAMRMFNNLCERGSFGKPIEFKKIHREFTSVWSMYGGY